MKKNINRRITLLLVFILTLTSLGLSSVFAYSKTPMATSASTSFSAESAGSSSIRIAWSAVSGATGYQLYRSEALNGTFALIKSTSATSYTDGNLTAGKTYYYKMRSYSGSRFKRVYSDFTAPVTAVPGSVTTPSTTMPGTTPTTTASTMTPSPTTTSTTITTPTTTYPVSTTETTTSPTTSASTSPTTSSTPTTTAATTKPATTTPTTTATSPTTSSTTASGSSLSVKSYGAVGDGIANDTAAIQQALNTGAADISIPDGTYMIDARVSLRPKSNQTIRLSSNAVLKVIPNAVSSYQLFSLSSVSNVEITGGKIVGDRTSHQGTAGEHGMGILIGKGASNIRIKSITIRDCWGDGIYIGSDSSGIARNILIENVTCDNNRRQGLTISQAEYVTVRNSIFKNTKGISPQAGLDIEPNSGCHVSSVTIKGCQFASNAGYGLVINAAGGVSVSDVTIDSNTFSGNQAGLCVSAANASNISLIIPAGTTRINDTEYAQCYGLTKVTIPSSVTTIGSGAFRACGKLTNITIPASVTTIGLEAFKYCTGLTTVSIPASVTAIDNWAFIGCSNLKSAYFYGNAPTTTNYLFYNCAADFRVYYIAGKIGFTSPTWRGYPASTFLP